MSGDNRHPSATIIVPVYNAEKYLVRCCQSILSQTHTDFELILSDDGSTDASPQICDNMAAKDCRVRVIHDTNAGVSAARNRGLSIASGEFVCFVDADDWIEPNTIKRILESADGYDLVVFSFINETKIGSFPVTFDRGKISIHEIIENYKNIKNADSVLCSVCNKAYRLETLKKTGACFDSGIKFGEDFILNSKYLSQTKNIRLLSDTLYHYDNEVENSGVKKVYHDFDCFINAMDKATEILLCKLDIAFDDGRSFRHSCISPRWDYAIAQTLNSAKDEESPALISGWLNEIPSDMRDYLSKNSPSFKSIYQSTSCSSLKKAIDRIKYARRRKKILNTIKTRIKACIFGK